MEDMNVAPDNLFEASRSEVEEEEAAPWCYAQQEDISDGFNCKISVAFGSKPSEKECSNAEEDSPEDTSEEECSSRIYMLDILLQDNTSSWVVNRTYKDFIALEQYLRSSVEFSSQCELLPVLPERPEENPLSFSNYLQQLLLHIGDFIWNCPQVLSFLDDTLSTPTIRDAHLSVLTEKIRGLTSAYRGLEMKLYDAQFTRADVDERLLRLESSEALRNEAGYGLDLVETNYEDSIAIYNESYAAAIDNYNSPDENDGELIPVGTLPPGPGGSGAAVSVVESSLTSSSSPNVSPIETDKESPPTPDPEKERESSLLALALAQTEIAEPTAAATVSDASDAHFTGSISSLFPSVAELSTDVTPTVISLVEPLSEHSEETQNGLEGNFEDSPNSPKSDIDQIREMVAKVIPVRRPVPPRIHSYKTCKFLPIISIPVNEAPDMCDVAVDAVLALLIPHEAQVVYRSSARAFLGRAVRHSLNAKMFESGLHAVQTFLPDDPIRLTVLLWRGNLTNWLGNLSEKLRILEQPNGAQKRVGASNGSGGIIMNGISAFDEDPFNENNFDIDNEPKPTGEHTISNINPSMNNGHSRMLCTIDSVPVEIMPNGRSDLCFLALVEELAQLVGKNELFKRSLLLIRGWWTYETSAYLGASSKNFLSDSVLCVLVCSIFNQYHAMINHPLQALSIFLAEFSEVKWGDVAITLQGVVPFHSNSVLDNQPWLREPLPSELVTSAILQKHCDFYHMCSTSTSRASATPAIAVLAEEAELKDTAASSGITTACSTPSETSRRETMSLAFLAIPVASPSQSAPPTPGAVTPYGPSCVSTAATVAAAAAQLSAKETLNPTVKRIPTDSHCYSPTAVRNFQKRIINIVHPLTNANMISNSLTADRATKISVILETGATDLNAVLEAAARMGADDEGGMPKVQTHFNSFFRGIVGRFSGAWRPDIFHNVLPDKDIAGTRVGFLSKPSDAKSGSIAVLPTVSLNEFFDQIRYMDLVLVGRVSESALLALSLDILVGRGVLPVGEIGKSLQDIAPTRNLSGKIKEKYGGLKKFLERYPEEVVICADHPFNPHVFLRKPLNRGDLELIAKGIIPPHLRKAMALRNKMRGAGTSQGSMDNNGMNQQMGGGMRHANPNMERNLNASAAAGMNFGHGNLQGHRLGVSMRINQQLLQQASKAQQQQSAQQQMFSQQQMGRSDGHQYRGQDSPGHSAYTSQYFQPMAPRDGDAQMMARNFALRSPGQLGGQGQFPSQMGSIGSGLGQDFNGTRRGADSLSEPYGVFGGRRSAAEGLLGGDVLGFRNTNSFGASEGQPRRYGETSPNGVLGLGGEVHRELGGGGGYDAERRFTESFHTENASRDSLASGFSSNGHPTRRPSVSMQQAAKSFSERDKNERDRALGLDTWGDPVYSLDRGIIEDRLRERDRYVENDFSAAGNADLFTSAALGGSSNQTLSDESSAEFYDQRGQGLGQGVLGQGLGRGYQQSLNRDPYLRGLEGSEHHTHSLQSGLQGSQSGGAGASLFLQQRDDELYEEEYALRDRQHQLQTIAYEDDQRNRLILQNQLTAVQRSGFRSPPQKNFDPKKWI